MVTNTVTYKQGRKKGILATHPEWGLSLTHWATCLQEAGGRHESSKKHEWPIYTFAEFNTTKSMSISHFFFGAWKFCMCVQSCPTLCNPTDCNPPGSSVHGIFQARILEWAAISFSNGNFTGIKISFTTTSWKITSHGLVDMLLWRS